MVKITYFNRKKIPSSEGAGGGDANVDLSVSAAGLRSSRVFRIVVKAFDCAAENLEENCQPQRR